MNIKEAIQILEPIEILANFCDNMDVVLCDEITSFYDRYKKFGKAILNALLIYVLILKKKKYQSQRYMVKILADWKKRNINTIDKAAAMLKKATPVTENATKNEDKYLDKFFEDYPECA